MAVLTPHSVTASAADAEGGQRVGDPGDARRQVLVRPGEAAGVVEPGRGSTGWPRRPASARQPRAPAGTWTRASAAPRGPARSPPPAAIERGVHDDFPTTRVCWVPRSRRPSAEAIVAVTTSPSCRYRGLRGLALEEQPPLRGRGQQRGELLHEPSAERSARCRPASRSAAGHRRPAAGTGTAGSTPGPGGTIMSATVLSWRTCSVDATG